MTPDPDSILTMDALVKIARAMDRGTLSVDLEVDRDRHWIQINNATPADRAWLTKTFGEPEVKVDAWARKAAGSRYQKPRAYHAVTLIHLLRPEDTTRKYLRDFPPRISLAGPNKPHECTEFVGFIGADGKSKWRCAERNCRKRITKTKAREVGLLKVTA